MLRKLKRSQEDISLRILKDSSAMNPLDVKNSVFLFHPLPKQEFCVSYLELKEELKFFLSVVERHEFERKV